MHGGISRPRGVGVYLWLILGNGTDQPGRGGILCATVFCAAGQGGRQGVLSVGVGSVWLSIPYIFYDGARQVPGTSEVSGTSSLCSTASGSKRLA